MLEKTQPTLGRHSVAERRGGGEGCNHSSNNYLRHPLAPPSSPSIAAPHPHPQPQPPSPTHPLAHSDAPQPAQSQERGEEIRRQTLPNFSPRSQSSISVRDGAGAGVHLHTAPRQRRVSARSDGSSISSQRD